MALSNTWKEKYTTPVNIETSFETEIYWLTDQRPPPIVAKPFLHYFTTCDKVSLPADSQEQESCYCSTEDTKPQL